MRRKGSHFFFLDNTEENGKRGIKNRWKSLAVSSPQASFGRLFFFCFLDKDFSVKKFGKEKTREEKNSLYQTKRKCNTLKKKKRTTFIFVSQFTQTQPKGSRIKKIGVWSCFPPPQVTKDTRHPDCFVFFFHLQFIFTGSFCTFHSDAEKSRLSKSTKNGRNAFDWRKDMKPVSNFLLKTNK